MRLHVQVAIMRAFMPECDMEMKGRPYCGIDQFTHLSAKLPHKTMPAPWSKSAVPVRRISDSGADHARKRRGRPHLRIFLRCSLFGATPTYEESET